MCAYLLMRLRPCPAQVFNGVTIATLLFITFCMTTYFVGQKTAVAKNDAARRRRFKTQCLNIFIWCVLCGALLGLPRSAPERAPPLPTRAGASS
jgi:hypothetical protein